MVEVYEDGYTAHLNICTLQACADNKKKKRGNLDFATGDGRKEEGGSRVEDRRLRKDQVGDPEGRPGDLARAEPSSGSVPKIQFILSAQP